MSTVSASAPPADDSRLQREVDYWHENLFGQPSPPEVREQYVEAHRHVSLDSRTPSSTILTRIVEERLDAEAIELHLRRTDPENALTAKFKILFYLLEIRGEYYARFVREEGSFLTSLPGLTLAAVRSVFKAARGKRQARRIDAG